MLVPNLLPKPCICEILHGINLMVIVKDPKVVNDSMVGESF